MSVQIRFDYYHLKIDKNRKRRSDTGRQYFGELSLSDLCQSMLDYHSNKPDEFVGTGKHLFDFKNGNKWVKWINIQEEDGVFKLLFTFNDKQVDPRILEDQQSNVLSQPIPEMHGQRTLLHIVIKPSKNPKAHANMSVQAVAGVSKECLLRIITHLTLLVSEEDLWVDKDPMTQKEINCKPHAEISPVSSDTIIKAVQDGLLRGVFLTERSDSKSNFDQANYIKETKQTILLRITQSTQFNGITDTGLRSWIKRVAASKKSAFQGDPNTYLIIKDPKTNSEIQHEVLNNTIMGFTKKEYLKWEDREPITTKKLRQETPDSIPQFYKIMIEGFK